MADKRLRLKLNAPVTVLFCLVCAAVQLLDILTRGGSGRALFSVYRTSLADPLAYLRVFLHVLGHGGWDHLLNNLMYLLILGPLLEEKYGSANLLFVILAAALATGLCSLIFFPNVRLMGASGVVFAFILLASITDHQDHTIPVTFLLVAVLYAVQQIRAALAGPDNVSQFAHITGGIVGSVLGFIMNKYRMSRYPQR